MKKMITTAILVGGLTMGGATFADSIEETGIDAIIPEMIEAEAQLTNDLVERAIIQDSYTENRLEKIDIVIGTGTGDDQVFQQLVEDIDQNITAIENIVDEAVKIGDDIAELEEVISEIIMKRSQNLLALLERDQLPEQAKAGIRKALANQERALARVAKAKELWKHVEEAIVKLDEELETEVLEVTEETSEVQSEETTNTEEVKESNNEIVKTNEKVEKTLTKAQEKIERTEERAQRHLEKGQTKAHEKALEKIERTKQQANEKVERTVEKAAEKDNKANKGNKDNKENKGNKGNKDNKGNGQGQGRP